MREALSEERYREKVEFCKQCARYGFYKQDYDLAYMTFTRWGRIEVHLVGFTKDCCILEHRAGDKVLHKIRMLPSEVMRHIRLYHNDLAEDAALNGDRKLALAMRKLVEEDTRRMKNAGINWHPLQIFDAYGKPENARLNFGMNKKSHPFIPS